jgi:hypothetical protein
MLEKPIVNGQEVAWSEISPDCKSALWHYGNEIIITDTLTNEIINKLNVSQSEQLRHAYRFINSEMIIFNSSPFHISWNFKTDTLQESTCSSFVQQKLFNNNYINHVVKRPYENYIIVKPLSEIKKDELIKQLEIIKLKRNTLTLFPKPCLVDFKIDSSKHVFFKSLEKN